MGVFLRDVVRLNAGQPQFPFDGPGRDASNRLAQLFEATERVWMEEILPYDVTSRPDGRVMEVLSEHYVPRLARRLSADRPPWPVLLLRGFHSHRRFDVQPARKMAEGLARHSMAAADRFAELSV